MLDTSFNCISVKGLTIQSKAYTIDVIV